ncbi:MAG: type II toxin-antitoxin system death-on-curing family toxin [Alphaproteobacteria bacterium]|nr:type II toxin-antitoxin system death-on-curing family toxin [Alphaproteobacteria bacterium]MCB9975711.1 type II toxin-antitoxin system death-on-curing family toxin [Rhodospirillales bacterium]
MSKIVWVLESVALAVHDAQVGEHGGLAGVRDLSLLQSALARPRNLLHYGAPDLAALAAAYGHGIARNHPFRDGNKRTAFVVSELFLLLNGFTLEADDAACVVITVELAGGGVSEEEFAAWLRGNMRKL